MNRRKGLRKAVPSQDLQTLVWPVDVIVVMLEGAWGGCWMTGVLFSLLAKATRQQGRRKVERQKTAVTDQLKQLPKIFFHVYLCNITQTSGYFVSAIED